MMAKLPKVTPGQTKKLKSGCTYDLVFATVGYERRARNVLEKLAPRSENRYALGFRTQQVLSYASNREWYESAKFQVFDLDDSEFELKVSEILRSFAAGSETDNPITILVDISSLTRSRLAILVDLFRSQIPVGTVVVDFYYTLARYDPPPGAVALNSHVGPVTASFAGWTSEPDRGVAAVVGLGYEQDKALGAVEHVQAVEIWTYTPSSPITQYSAALLEANKTLLESVADSHKLVYAVADPVNLFAGLESLIYRLSQQRNVILFPFGPKTFTLCSLLAACWHPHAAVWRVSAEALEDPTDRLPSEFIFGLRAEFEAIPLIRRPAGSTSHLTNSISRSASRKTHPFRDSS